jgi:hypothetical protein
LCPAMTIERFTTADLTAFLRKSRHHFRLILLETFLNFD